MASVTVYIPDQATAPPADLRRAWLLRRAALSAHAVDLLLEHALGGLRSDAIDWPVPAWAGAPAMEAVAHG